MTGKDVLIIEDEPMLAALCAGCLQEEAMLPRMAATGETALKMLEEKRPDAIILDLGLPDADGLALLRRLRAEGMDSAVIVMTGQTRPDTVIAAMQAGADDFVAKPFDPERLQVSVRNALEKKRLEKLVHAAGERASFRGFTGAAPEMQAVYRIIENAAKSSAAVMITGESGTGKELAAEAIHALSPRAKREMVALNCAAIPANLLESEIFGHVKGAFTGATETRRGAAMRADGSTLFLDELAEMPVDLQSKLLRFVQTGSFTPVGGSAVQRVDIRFVSATNRDPLEAVRQGRLREDLYYRLAVIPVALPPLRDRGGDVLLLAENFLARAARKEGKRFSGFSDSARAALLRHGWPGNVRELENVIFNAVVMNAGGTLTAEMLKFTPDSRIPAAPKPAPAAPRICAAGDIRPLADIEAEIIADAIAACDGNVTEAARRLGINASTIYRRRKK